MKTRLMVKLFSEDTTPEFKEKVSEKIDEALENGKSELKTSEEDLRFADVGHEVIIEDMNNGEITKVNNPDEENAELEAVDINEETKTQSVSEPDVDVNVVEGTDGTHLTNTVPEVTIDIMEGIGDAKKAGVKGKNFSITLKNATMSQIKAAYKVFAETEELEVESPEGELNEEVTTESDKESEKKADEIIEKANELKDSAKDMITDPTKEKAEKVKEEAEKVKTLCDEADEEVDSEEVKSYCKIFSEQADAIIAKADADAAKEDDKPEEAKVDEANDGPKKSTKVESECEGKECKDSEDKTEEKTEEKTEDEVLKDTKKTFSATKTLLDSANSVCPAFLHENHEDRLFSKNEARKSTNKFLYTSFE